MSISLPVDNFAYEESSFDATFNPTKNAPANILQTLSVVPNYFSSCTFTDKMEYLDGTGTKRLFGVNEREIIPITQINVVTTQTNRDIEDFIITVEGECKITSSDSNYSNLRAVADSGNVILNIYAAKPDGSLFKVYTDFETLDVKNKDLSTERVLFKTTIPAETIEKNLPKQSTAYQSYLRVVPQTELQIHYEGLTGLESTKWTVGGRTESNLRITVENDQYQCLVGCLFTNREINVDISPSNGEVPINNRRVSFTVTLPEWNSDQGSPTWKIVNAETGNDVTRSSSLQLSQVGSFGKASKSLLLPESVGRYDLVITQQGRDSAIKSFNVFKTETTPPITCPEGTTLVDGECKPSSNPKPTTCPEGYKLVNGECFLEKTPGDPQVPNEINDFLTEYFECLSSNTFSCHEKYYGIYAAIWILVILIVIVAAATRRK